MYNVILAGGSGLRVLESIIHFCAMGLGPPVMRLFVIDPDHSNGNATRASRLVAKYLECQLAYGGKMGAGVNWFGTRLDLLGDDKKPELMVWSPVKPTDTLGSIIDYDNLASTDTPPEMADLLFTREERQVQLGGGFRGIDVANPVLRERTAMEPIHSRDPGRCRAGPLLRFHRRIGIWGNGGVNAASGGALREEHSGTESRQAEDRL